MLIVDSVTQPHGKSNRDLISKILTVGGINQIDVAAAYVTIGGARDLLSTMKEHLGVQWETASKRWLIAFDYCRTEPIAAKMLADAPKSLVRIHDAVRVLRHNCNPIVPFHPKAFLFKGPKRHAVLAGSGNVSRSGLNTGHEVGLLFDCHSPTRSRGTEMRTQIKAVQAWYELKWRVAPPLTAALAAQYRTIFDAAENLRHPTPTDDDHAVPSVTKGSLTANDLRKLRACSHYWIEAGNVTKNLGPSKPGNQLMMKRLSRVFFGVPPDNVPQNSPLRQLEISYQGASKSDCSLTFSDNGMDKLTLPIPGAGGPAFYDGKTLLFIRKAAGVFQLEIGSQAERRNWIRKSDAIDGRQSMPPHGRQWGVF